MCGYTCVYVCARERACVLYVLVPACVYVCEAARPEHASSDLQWCRLSKEHTVVVITRHAHCLQENLQGSFLHSMHSTTADSSWPRTVLCSVLPWQRYSLALLA